MNFLKNNLLIWGSLLIIVFASDIFGGNLSTVLVSPRNSAAGETSFYDFNFTTSDTGNGTDIGIPVDGKIAITFPLGFDVSLAEIAVMSFEGGAAGGFSAITTIGPTVTLTRDSTGSAVPANKQVSITIVNIGNNQLASSYTVAISTQKSDSSAIDSGVSAPFSISHNDLDHFTFDEILDQTAGASFTITIRARDAYENIVTSYGSTVNLSDKTSTLTPASTNNFITGSWSGSVLITKTYAANTLTATAGGDAGTSNSFNINPGTVSHFTFSSVTSPKTAGTAFAITIAARDAYENIVTNFSEAVTLSDNTGTLFPTSSGTFSAGSWSGDVTITKKQTDVYITATNNGANGQSNTFNIQAAALNHFIVTNISNQTAGMPFSITVYAKDEFNNTVENYTGTVRIQDLTPTGISPSTSGSFTNGFWSGNVTIRDSYTNDIITVTRTSGGSQSGSSNGFNVNSGTLDHFDFVSIPTSQTAGTSFTISLVAKDANNNTITNFTETANLTDLTGTINPSVTGGFTGGAWSGGVTITKTKTSNTITAISSGKIGISNAFNVSAGTLHHFTFESINSPQRSRQSFTITIIAEDVFNNQCTAFNQTVNLNDDTGTVFPLTSGSFSDGQWSGTVIITKSQNDNSITASRDGITGRSNLFNVNPGSLHHFVISAISTQAAGEPFLLTITAQDLDNNRVDSFTGTVTISDLSNSVLPTSSTNFTSGMWTGNLTIVNTYANNRISVVRSGGSETGSSNYFDVVAGEVDRFVISTISSPQQAGNPFEIIITAVDGNNSTVTNFTGTVNLNDNTGTISPKTTTNFNNGQWRGNVTITESYASNVITVSGSGRAGNSNAFTVLSGNIHHFNFATIVSPQTAGQYFNIVITAKDQFENTVTSFTDRINLSDNTTTLTPLLSGNFSNGVRTESVRITDAENNDRITASYGSASGQSNFFNVEAATLHHFSIGTISTQQAGVPFTISVRAEDEFNNQRTQFTGQVTISDITTTITPTISGNFINGQWTDNVKITQAQSSNIVTVRRSGGSEQGSSNQFNVISSNVDHFVINSIASPQTAGATFNVTITAKDAQNNTVTSFISTGNLSDETGTLLPMVTGAFNNGVWSGALTITKSWTGNSITFTSSGKAGSSNDFDVNPSSLHHFRFENINSPRVAGQGFPITIYAEDVYNNRVTSFTTYASLNDNTSTINPTQTGNFSTGSWSGNVSITRSTNDIKITASRYGSSGESNLFNVEAATLDHFTLEPISTQAAGEQFSVSMTAQDIYNNTRTQFSGTVNISDLTNTLTPMMSTNFNQGKWTGNVMITQARDDDQISVQRTGGSERGTSNVFDVISSAVDHFDIGAITSPQEAGIPFTITITARDGQNNVVTGFNGTGNLGDESGTIFPTETSSFSGGIWTGSVTITRSYSNDKITFTSSGKAGVSNLFNVNPTILHHFRFETVGSPLVAGTGVSVTIYAEDAYNNRVTSFTTYVDLYDNTGTLTPLTSGSFTSGRWSGNVTITKSANDVVITASRYGSSGSSNKFNINAASLHHFTLGTISTQAAGEPFSITVVARDQYENIRTQFTSTVDISDLTGSVTPTMSGNFTQGQWTGNIVINNAREDNRISVFRTGGTENGSSVLFDVISSSVDHFVFNTITSPQEAGVPFSITITAKDAQNNTVVNFTGTGVLSDKTGTITPAVTGSFSNGVWTSSVTITKSMQANSITITSSGKAGISGDFNVVHNDLDHFKFMNINSPQIAGSQFLVEITAEDQYNNTVTSFNTYVTLSEATGTINPSTTPNFINGKYSGLVSITRAQSDLRITCTSTGKSGQSNIFNVIAGALQRFQIGSISTQAAGEPFTISVSALDAYNNVAKSFTGTVDITDLTNTIDPDISDNFIEGKWTGSTTITQKRNDDRITVTRTGGTQTGQSNLFNVISSEIDHFIISTITSPKVAGQGFSISITAEDKDNNVVDSFTGTAKLSDLTNTISPSTTTNFISGVWSGTVTITKSFTNNIITVTSSGKAGNSNSFTITHATLDHFAFASIPSPQTAGSNFTISITAEDLYVNKVLSYNSTVQLSDNTLTINPTTSGNFSSGSWSGSVRITKSQNDVKITATGSGKSGTSNGFNINPNILDHFSIKTINTQAAGEPFALEAKAQDIYNNTATSFVGTVNISDLTTTISPNVSENFAAGLWTGNVTITTVRDDNRITVIDPLTSKRGESNLFDVISSDVDHFLIANITSPKTAGVPFQITITAQDKDNNKATAFNGTVSLTDITATMKPTSSGVFTNGEWTGQVKITKARIGDKITVNALGKAGVSNDFNVSHGALDRFVIESIPSPQTAGILFSVKITAKDSMANTVQAFQNYVDFTDNTTSISPTRTTNFVSGEWNGSIYITKSQPDVFVTASRDGKSGRSNNFYVRPDKVNYLKITDAAGGKGLEVGDRTLALKEKIKIYAAGYDKYNNYVREVQANWGKTGTLDIPAPLTGEWTIFESRTPGTSGTITADSTSILPDATGTITVGTISYVRIESLSGGNKPEVGDVNITADDELKLYCAGYDAGSNYIGDVVVKWQSTGGLQPSIDDSAAWIRFNPTKAPVMGKIVVTHPIAQGYQTGTITVSPGIPFGTIHLTADPPVLPADGTTISTITSDAIYDADSNRVAKNTLFTIEKDGPGTITSPDVSSTYPGIQVAANDSGAISVNFKAPSNGGFTSISVSSPVGSATGHIRLVIASLNIISVIADKKTVSQGQKGARVEMTVQNLGSTLIDNIDAGLIFTGPPPLRQNRKDDFPVVVRLDTITTIPGGLSKTFLFGVDVSIAAHLDTVTIDGIIMGKMAGISVRDDSAKTVDRWLVQTPANLVIERVSSLLDTVSQGQENVKVSMRVRNSGQADANIVQDTLIFKTIPQLQDITNEFKIISSDENLTVVKGGLTEVFNLYVHVLPQATLGSVKIDGKIYAKDWNTETLVKDETAGDSTHTWFIREAPLVSIQSFLPSQQKVSQNQTVPWFILLKTVNIGGTPVRLDRVQTNFILGGNDLTSEYTIDHDSTFIGSGNNILQAHSEDSLRITIKKTGSSTGEITITGEIFLTDLGTGKPVMDQTKTGITVLTPAQLVISKVIPSAQKGVTRNQGQDWYVYLVIENKGQSDIKIRTARDSSYIRFSTGTDFTIIQPQALSSGGLILGPNSLDTLTYKIDGTGIKTGRAYIDAIVTGIEMTTGLPVQATSIHSASVVVEEPCNVRILSVDIQETANDTIVNTNQPIKMDVTIQNIGQDSVLIVYVGLQSDGPSLQTKKSEFLGKTIAGGGDTAVKSFYFNAASLPQNNENCYANIDSAVAENTNESAGVIYSMAVDSIETITIQTPSELRIMDIILPQSVRAGQVEDWSLEVILSNSKQADVLVDIIKSPLPVITIGGEVQNDYAIQRPTTLQSGGLYLKGGTSDKLIYTVTATGNSSGDAVVGVNIVGNDRNDQHERAAIFNKNMTINTSATIRLSSTKILCKNYDVTNLGLVNRGQTFRIKTVLENRGRVQIDNIQVQLITDGNSVIQKSIDEIPAIAYGQSDSVYFYVVAGNTDNEMDKIETFEAKIISAIDHDTGDPVSIDNRNTLAKVKIQEPASLAVDALSDTLFFTISQKFVLQAMVNNLGSAETYDTGTMAVFLPESYRFVSGQDTVSYLAPQPFTVGDTIRWNILTPNHASLNDLIYVAVLVPVKDKNTQAPANIIRQNDSLIVNTIDTKILSNSKIISPTGAIDDTLSTYQVFTIRSMIQYSPNVENVTATISLPDGYQLDAGAAMHTNIARNDTIDWRLRAPEIEDNFLKYIDVYVTGNEIGIPTPVIEKDSVSVFTVRRTELALMASINGSQNVRLSRGQEFQIIAMVNNNGFAVVYGDAVLRLSFRSADYRLKNPGETFEKSFEIGKQVIWNAIAPNKITDKSDIIVSYKTIPYDENSNNRAEIDNDIRSVTIQVTTEEGGMISNKIYISGPEGAMDAVLSSEQEFTITGIISSSLVDSIEAKLDFSPGFTFAPNVNQIQSVTEDKIDTVFWKVKAAAIAALQAVLKITASGTDRNDKDKIIISNPDSIIVQVVERAVAQVHAEIISPHQATDNFVSTGQDFVIAASMIKYSGTAELKGDYTLRLQLPSEYRTQDQLNKTADISQSMQWSIQAPEYPVAAKNIDIIVTSEPYDENTYQNEKVMFISGGRKATVPITTIEKTIVVDVMANVIPLNTIAKGETGISLVGLEFSNTEGDILSNEVILYGMKLKITDRTGTPLENVNHALSKILTVKYENHDQVYGVITNLSGNSEIQLIFAKPDTIWPAMPGYIELLGDIAPDASVSDFMVVIDSASSFYLKEAHNPKTPIIQTADGKTGASFKLQSNIIRIVADNLKDSFCNYPNPFGDSSKPTTTIFYYLKEDTDVEIKIFTLLGELVRSWSFKAEEPEGKKGTHNGDVRWDARNGNGHKVLNGVYVAYIKTGLGESTTTKVAVLK